MGLDVYLYHYTDREKSKQNEEAYDTYSAMLWDKLKDVDADPTDKAKEHIIIKLNEKALELGLGKYGEDITYKTRIENDSVLHPEHYFKIGYFRSSYNGSGINNVLRDLNIPGLYEIFEHEDDDFEFSPDWNRALEVVNDSIKLIQEDKGYRVETVSPNMFNPDEVPNTPAMAMAIFQDQVFSHVDGKAFNEYSNRFGTFYLGEKGLEITATIPGKNFMNHPCTYIIYKCDNKYLLQSMEIVKETIEFVLKQEDPQNYYLSWSG